MCFQYSGRANLKPVEEIGSSMFSFHRTSQHIPVSSTMKWSCFISCWSFVLLYTLTGASTFSTFCEFIELGPSWCNSSTVTCSLSSLASISNWRVYTSLYFVLCINPARWATKPWLWYTSWWPANWAISPATKAVVHQPTRVNKE